MDGRLDWTELFFSSAGRLSRGPFLLAAAAVLSGLLLLHKAIASPAAEWITGWVVYPLLVFCGVSVTAKRLHDRGRSGWWAGLVIACLTLVLTGPQTVLDALAALVLVWAAVELSAMPGEPGANRYGPDPGPARRAARV